MKLSLLLVLLHVCVFFSSPANAAVSKLDVDFKQIVRTTTNQLYGTVDNNLNPAIAGTQYMRYMADMDIPLVRIVSQLQDSAWFDNTTRSWKVSVIDSYFTEMRNAYAGQGKEMPNFIIAIKQWPTWIFGNSVLPDELVANYTQLCADLVKIIRIDLGVNATYWQPFNNLDNVYGASNLNRLINLYNETVTAMKEVDPEIKVGPSFSAEGSGNALELISKIPTVDFLNYHYYFTRDLTLKTTEEIFATANREINNKATNFAIAVKDRYPNIPLIMDEFGLHFGTQDPRAANYVAALWLATVHIYLASSHFVAACNYNVRSDSFGLIANNNAKRSSSRIVEWTNTYFVGDVVRMSIDDGRLQVFAVQKNDVSAIYIINTNANDTLFTFSSLSGIDDTYYTLEKHTVNATGWFEDEVTEEWWSINFNATHSIAGYSAIVLFYNASAPIHFDPPTIPPSPSPTPAATEPPKENPEGYNCREENGIFICSESSKMRSYNAGLSAGLGAFVGVGFVIAVFAIVILAFHWEAYTKKYGTFYCAVILSGVMLSYAAALTLLPRPTDTLCVVFPWLLGTGFTLVYGCLFIKTWILYRLWRHAMQLKRMSITALTVIKYVGVALLVEIILLVIWTVIDPPSVRQVEMVDNTLQNHCHSDKPIFWIIFLCLKGVWLIFGAVITILTRDVIKEYNDFSAIAYAIYNNVILIAIAIPLALVLEKVPDGVLLISVIVIVLAFTFTIVILFYETWLAVLFPNSKLPTGILQARRKNTELTASTHLSSGHSKSSTPHSSRSSSE